MMYEVVVMLQGNGDVLMQSAKLWVRTIPVGARRTHSASWSMKVTTRLPLSIISPSVGQSASAIVARSGEYDIVSSLAVCQKEVAESERQVERE